MKAKGREKFQKKCGQNAAFCCQFSYLTDNSTIPRLLHKDQGAKVNIIHDMHFVFNSRNLVGCGLGTALFCPNWSEWLTQIINNHARGRVGKYVKDLFDMLKLAYISGYITLPSV